MNGPSIRTVLPVVVYFFYLMYFFLFNGVQCWSGTISNQYLVCTWMLFLFKEINAMVEAQSSILGATSQNLPQQAQFTENLLNHQNLCRSSMQSPLWHILTSFPSTHNLRVSYRLPDYPRGFFEILGYFCFVKMFRASCYYSFQWGKGCVITLSVCNAWSHEMIWSR